MTTLQTAVEAQQMSNTIALFQTNHPAEAPFNFQWDPAWSPETKLQALRKYAGRKFFWVDRGERREHLAITIQILLDQADAAKLKVKEDKYFSEPNWS